jgi:hypothetical protein
MRGFAAQPERQARWRAINLLTSLGQGAEEVIRCVMCGCSRWDSKGVGCVLCGGSPSVRDEQVHVGIATKSNLVADARQLENFGVTIREVRCFRKVMGASETSGVVLEFSEPFEPEILRDLVLHLDYLGIPKAEIFRLRLAEPEQIESALAARA